MAFGKQAVQADQAVYPSDLNELIQRTGGKIPFPPEKFMQQISDVLPYTNFSFTVIPQGRSLERSFLSFSQPRSLYASSPFMTGLSKEGIAGFPLFVGYTPQLQQLEIISWNWKTRKYDFSLASDYREGGTATLRPARRSLCMSCHQNGGPIFPVPDWTESSGDLRVLRLLRATPHMDPAAQWIIDQEDGLSNNVGIYDAKVRAADNLMRLNRICDKICNDADCRLYLIKAAFVPDFQFSPSDRKAITKFIKNNYDPKNFVIANSFLRERRDSTPPFPIQFKTFLDPLALRNADRLDEGNLEILFITDNRSDAGTRYCFNFSADDLRSIRARWKEAIHRFDSQEMRKLATDRLPLGQEVADVLLNRPLKLVRTPIIENLSTEIPERSESSNLFVKYCASCHSGAHPASNIALPLNDIAQLKSYKSIFNPERTIQAVLEGKKFQMPPVGSPLPTATEKETMLKQIE